MKQHKIEMVLQAREPIAHSEGTVGNVQVIMRRRLRLPKGVWTKVPYITGDTMRHGLREAGAWALLEAAGMTSNADLSEAALRLLFSGGMITGSARPVIKLDEERRWRELVPHLALLGGCIGNRIVPGKMEVGDGLLICSETAHLLPGWVLDEIEADGGMLSSARGHIDMQQRVRMDPVLSPVKRRLLTDESATDVERRLLASARASEAGDDLGKSRAKSTMMPFQYETLGAGSLFYWRVDALTHTELEHDALYVMLAAFLSKARVGGKKGTGHGLLSLMSARGAMPLAADEQTMDALAVTGEHRVPEITRFKAHIGGLREEITEWLRTVVA